MREAPLWFQSELARAGGVNHYGEPIFKLVWSRGERMLVGGRFHDGFEGYREKRAVDGDCWALMIWEPASMFGSPDRWEWDYRDAETGLLDCGGFPKYGRYRLLQKFIHREIVERAMFRQVWDGQRVRTEQKTAPQVVTYRMEPCGFMLDIMLPMIKAWRGLTDQAKRAALKQEAQFKNDEIAAKAKDIRSQIRVRRGSALVQKRAEVIQRGMEQAMRIASMTGLGMRQA